VSGLIGSEAIRRVIVPGRTVLQPDREQTYVCFVDGASGVAGGDSFCAAWAHFDKSRDRAILDQVYERRPPFNADDCIHEITAICRQYRCERVIGDAWAGDLLRQRWVALTGASYDVSNRSKSQIYLDWLPLVSSMRIEMLDDDRAVQQALGLERRTTRGSNREVVDHGPTTSDDRINAIAGVLVHCADVSGKVTWSTDDPNWHLYLQAADAGLSANEIAPQAAPITPPAAASFNQGARALTELQQATDARREHSSHLSDPGPLSRAKS
jgi:hypothetical protein